MSVDVSPTKLAAGPKLICVQQSRPRDLLAAGHTYQRPLAPAWRPPRAVLSDVIAISRRTRPSIRVGSAGGSVKSARFSTPAWSPDHFACIAVSPGGDHDDGETLDDVFHAREGLVSKLGFWAGRRREDRDFRAVVAGAAIVEAALILGLLIGSAAV
jgi:hypothetical protein